MKKIEISSLNEDQKWSLQCHLLDIRNLVEDIESALEKDEMYIASQQEHMLMIRCRAMLKELGNSED